MSTANVQSQMDHWGADRGPQIIAAAVILIVATPIFVGLRLYAQKLIKPRFDLDDYLIMVALVLCFGICATTIICVHYGIGKHLIRDLKTDPDPPFMLVNLFKAIWIEGLLWCLETPLVKIAILLFYRRVFSGNQKWFRWAFLIMTGYAIAWGIATFIIVVVQCLPIPYFWNRAYAFYEMTPPDTGKCLDTTPSQVPVCLINSIADLVLLLLPFPVLLRLQMNMRRKVEIGVIFGLGVFVLAASIVRLRFIWLDENSGDPTWDDAETLVWTPAECCVGVICACIPCMAPLRRFLPGGSRFHTTHHGGNTTKSWGNTKGDLSGTASRRWVGLESMDARHQHPAKGELYDSASSGELATDGWGARMGRLDAEAHRRMADGGESGHLPVPGPGGPEMTRSQNYQDTSGRTQADGFVGGPLYAPNWKGVVVNKGFAGPLSSNEPDPNLIPANAIKISKEMESVEERRRKSDR